MRGRARGGEGRRRGRTVVRTTNGGKPPMAAPTIRLERERRQSREVRG
jgi:hypothetical protein